MISDNNSKPIAATPSCPHQPATNGFVFSNGEIHSASTQRSRGNLAVSGATHAPVLKVEFDFILKYDRNAPPHADNGSTDAAVLDALWSQLGLRLESTKGPIERLTIDPCGGAG